MTTGTPTVMRAQLHAALSTARPEPMTVDQLALILSGSSVPTPRRVVTRELRWLEHFGYVIRADGDAWRHA